MTANDNTTGKPGTPPPAHDAAASTHHLPPSAPTSPLAKRAKAMAGTTAASTGNDDPAANIKVEESPPLLVKKLSDRAKTPTRGSAFAAGYDLYRYGRANVRTSQLLSIVLGGFCREDREETKLALSYEPCLS